MTQKYFFMYFPKTTINFSLFFIALVSLYSKKTIVNGLKGFRFHGREEPNNLPLRLHSFLRTVQSPAVR